MRETTYLLSKKPSNKSNLHKNEKSDEISQVNNINHLYKKKKKIVIIYNYFNKIKLQYVLSYYGIGFITSLLSFAITTLTALNKFDVKYDINNQKNIDYLLFIISILITGFTLLLNFFKIETQINKLINICNNYKDIISELNEYIVKCKIENLSDTDIYNIDIMLINKFKIIHIENLNLFCDICSSCCKDNKQINEFIDEVITNT